MHRIQYPSTQYIPSFYKALGQVAAEKVYLEMVEPPPFEKVETFQKKLIENGFSGCYAILNDEVIGWADIFPGSNPRLAHRGFLGMGLLKKHRGKGIGQELLKFVIDHAKTTPLEKVELSVYTNNIPAIKIYEKFGFQKMGSIKHYRKVDGTYFDTVEMELFL